MVNERNYVRFHNLTTLPQKATEYRADLLRPLRFKFLLKASGQKSNCIIIAMISYETLEAISASKLEKKNPGNVSKTATDNCHTSINYVDKKGVIQMLTKAINEGRSKIFSTGN